jgi:hypothetical protein
MSSRVGSGNNGIIDAATTLSWRTWTRRRGASYLVARSTPKCKSPATVGRAVDGNHDGAFMPEHPDAVPRAVAGRCRRAPSQPDAPSRGNGTPEAGLGLQRGDAAAPPPPLGAAARGRARRRRPPRGCACVWCCPSGLPSLLVSCSAEPRRGSRAQGPRGPGPTRLPQPGRHRHSGVCTSSRRRHLEASHDTPERLRAPVVHIMKEDPTA